MNKLFIAGLFLLSCLCSSLHAAATTVTNLYPRSVFVQHQLSYMPILENSLVLNQKIVEPWCFIFSAKPIYLQSVGNKFKSYFTINYQQSLNVQENGSGDIGSLWFQVMSSNTTFYSSTLTFDPKLQKYGSMLYFAASFAHGLQVALNTAIVGVRTTLNMQETNIQNPGIVPGFASITESFASPTRLYGKVGSAAQTKAGVDDIQLKLIWNGWASDCSYFDMYALVGIPTGTKPTATYLFEPLVGSRHAQLGAGMNALYTISDRDDRQWSVFGELKYRYAFKAHELRSFDLTANGQWSRYMLLVNESNKFVTFPAINTLTFNAHVTPRSSFDLYLATQVRTQKFKLELGWDFWARSEEKITLNATLPSVGVADLVGIAALNPQSASTATISQAVQPGVNQMVSDPAFVPVRLRDVNLISGSAPRSLSNTIYGSIGYYGNCWCHAYDLAVSAAYERGTNINVPDSVMVWVNLDFYLN